MRAELGRCGFVLAMAVAVLAAGCSSSGEAASGEAARDASSGQPSGEATSGEAPGGAAGPVEPVASPGCDAPAAEPGISDRTISSGGQERRYELTIPDSYTGEEPLPIVFGLHALTVSYRIVPSITGFADMADTYDFIGVSPSGLLDGPTAYWSSTPWPENTDVAFFEDLLDALEAELCVDTARIYSTGMSNGAQMSSVLACQLSERITAVAPVAGVEFSEVCDGEQVPVMAFHGAADPIVTYEGGGLNGATITGMHNFKGEVPDGVPTHDGVDASMARWSANNGCDPEPVEEQVSPSIRRFEWQNCDAATILYVHDGGGHAWPGKPQPAFEAQFGPGTTEIDASELIFEFFFATPRR